LPNSIESLELFIDIERVLEFLFILTPHCLNFKEKIEGVAGVVD